MARAPQFAEPLLAFCCFTNQVSSVGREEEERPLTPDQGQVGGERSFFL